MSRAKIVIPQILDKRSESFTRILAFYPATDFNNYNTDSPVMVGRQQLGLVGNVTFSSNTSD